MINRIASRLLRQANEQGEFGIGFNGEPGVYFKNRIPDWDDVRNSQEFSTFVKRIKSLQDYFDDGGQTTVDGMLYIADAAEKLIPYLKDLAQKYKIEAEQYYNGVTGTKAWQNYEKSYNSTKDEVSKYY